MRLILNHFRAFGVDPLKAVIATGGLVRYVSNLISFLRQNSFRKISLSPVLTDFKDFSGSADGHYFWQDLICARWIFEEKPMSHVDIGSRVDGFVAHLLTFRDVQVIDIRELGTEISGLKTLVMDLQAQIVDSPISDSVSSLHSIEHFGLGRYGDQIDVDGHIKGLINISRMVADGGFLYISFPIGKVRIEFNAQRVLAPAWPIPILENFELIDFVLIPWKGQPIFDSNPYEVDTSIFGQAGLYKFKKVQH